MKARNYSFIFDGYSCDKKIGQADFFYIINHGKETLHLKETLLFPSLNNKIHHKLLDSIFINLSLALGISYWKIFCPKKIITPHYALSKTQAEFWNALYTHGLGEFFYKNKIDFRGLIKFPYQNISSPKPMRLSTKNHSLAMIGGGKDSIVSTELLKKSRKHFTPFLLNKSEIQMETLRVLGKKPLIVKRAIDSQLFKLNKRRDTYNGHVPITAIYSFTALLTAVFHKNKYIIASNEKSANYGNMRYLGTSINHQWSKSYEFERSFNKYIKKYITPDITYFSFLRSLNEIKIAEIFSKNNKYFKYFSSCNTNFAILKKSDRRWCGRCPKCAFVFASLAPFISKKDLLGIFGQNLFEKKALLPLFEELLGIKNFKPFECVGTPEETRLAFYKASQKDEFTNDVAIRMFKKEFIGILPKIAKSEKKLMRSSTNHGVPEEFLRALSFLTKSTKIRPRSL